MIELPWWFAPGMLILHSAGILVLAGFALLLNRAMGIVMNLQSYMITSKASELNMLMQILSYRLDNTADPNEIAAINKNMDAMSKELAKHQTNWGNDE